MTLTARNALGIETTATMAVIVDRTLAGFDVAPHVFSPNNDGRLDTANFGFTLNNPARVTLNLRRGSRLVGQVFSGALTAGAQSIVWNGRFAAGRRARVPGRCPRDLDGRDRAADGRVRHRHDRAEAQARLGRDAQVPINEPGDVTVVFDGTRTVTRRRLAPGKFSVPPGGAFTSFTRVARDFAGNDGRASRARSGVPRCRSAARGGEQLDEELDAVDLGPVSARSDVAG